jgi:hypothetical protein
MNHAVIEYAADDTPVVHAGFETDEAAATWGSENLPVGQWTYAQVTYGRES